jgi:hypothetical protein
MMRRFYFGKKLVFALLLLIPVVSISMTAGSASAGYSPLLRRYPYLTDVVDSYATINWATDQSNFNAAVRWGKVGAESCTAHYVEASRTAVTVNSVAEYQWKAMLTLAPGTQYCYRVYLGSGPSTEVDLLGSDSSPVFWTQVPSGSSQPYSFAVFGDWGYVDSTGANPYQARLMSLIAGSGARFALTAGDNGYPSGNQSNYGDLIQTGNSISAIFGPLFWKVPGSSIPIFPASGNHGITNSDPNHPLILNFPQAMAVALSGGRYVKETYCCIDGTSSANYPSAWYAFDAGLARIYVLDASWADGNIGTASMYQVDHDYHWTPTSPEYQWLQADLSSHASVLKFAIWHFPLYSDDPNQASDTYLQGTGGLEGLFKQYGVDIGFAGHSHTYQRFYASPVGLPSYVTGGGGSSPGTLGTCTALDAYAIKFTTSGKACGSAPVPTSVDQFYHFLLVTVNGTSVTVAPVNSLGQTFDQQTYNLSAGSETVPPSVPSGLTAAAASGTQINLNWAASSDNTGVRGYDVYRNGSLVATTDAATLGYSDTNLVPATSYVYTVDAFDGYGNHSTASSPASVSTSSTATYTFTPVADAYVRGDTPTTNYGIVSSLKADASPDYHSYLRFNVGGISGTVTKATIQLYSTSSSAVGYRVQSVAANTWDESQVTYANAPALGAVVGSSGRFSSANWVSVDVTPLITGNGLYDLAVTTTSTSSMTFYSRDAAAFWPQLVIQTSSAAATATNTPINTPLPTATPTFAATATTLPTSTPTTVALPTNTPTATPTSATLPTTTPTPTAMILPTNTPTSTPTASAAFTIGEGNILGNDDSGNGNLLVAQQTTLAQDATIQSLSFYVATAVGHLRLGIYDAAGPNGGPGALIAQTNEFTPTAGWNTQNVMTPAQLIAGTYWLVYLPESSDLHFAMAPSGSARWYSYSYGPLPASYSASPQSGTYHWSFYGTLITGVHAPTTPTNTPTSAVLPTDTPTATSTSAVLPTDTPTAVILPTNTPMATPTVAAAPVFSDGFESGTLAAWSATTGLVIESATVHGGVYAAEGNTTTGNTYAKKTLPATYNDGYSRIYFNLVSYSSQVNLLRFRDSAGNSIGYLFVSTSGKLGLRNDVGAITTTSTTAVGAGWHVLELHMTVNGTSGITEAWLDGVQVSSLSLTTNLGTTPIGGLQIGEVQTGRTYDVLFDDVVFDIQRVGP